MKIGITCGGLGDYGSEEFLRLSVQAAENVGFSSYWLPEHVVLFKEYPESKYPYAEGSGQEKPDQDPDAPLKFGEENPHIDPRITHVDPVVGMTWLAAVSTKIEVGTNILILPQRNPVVLAKALATLDFFSGGRVVLGVGVGWCKEEFDAVRGDWKNRGKRTNEHIEVMRALWQQEASSYSGDTYSFDGAYCYPKPARPGGVPVLIGGESKAALRRVARLGDGWLPFNLPVDDAAKVISELREMTRQEGRDPDKLRIIKIIFSNAKLDDVKRYRDAGVTEFNMASNGELPLDEAGIRSVMEEFGQKIVEPVANL